MNKIKFYNVRGKKIEIEYNDKIFAPSTLSLLFAKHIKIKKMESVFDCGCGSGFLGILAVKLGAKKAKGSEINRESIKFAKKNAKRNKANFTPLYGSFFAGNKELFDVIIANLPQGLAPKKLPEKERKKQSLERWPGNKLIITFLKEAKKHLKKKGRIYCTICHVTDYKLTLEEISKNYEMKMIAKRRCPLPKLMEEIPGSKKEYKNLCVKGKIRIMDKLIELKLKR